jgi:lysozyme
MNLIKQLKQQEGFSSVVYKCPGGFNTIGYGYNLDANPLKLSSLEIAHAHTKGMPEHEADRLLKLMINKLQTELPDKIKSWSRLSQVRKDILVNMAFNMGVDGLLEFKAMLACLSADNYLSASDEMLNSKWKKQVKGRAIVLAEQMRLGVYASR